MIQTLNPALGDVRNPYVVVSARDLLTQPYTEPTFLVEHLIPERSVVLLSADSGAGKTSFMLNAVFSLGLGMPIANRFGAFGTRPTLYVNGEMSTGTLVRFMYATIAGLGVDVEECASEKVLFEGANGLTNFFLAINDKTAADYIEGLLERVRPQLIVLDTFRSLFEADENKSREVREVFAWLRRLCEAYDLSIVVSHHLRKLSQVSNNQRERVSGSRDLIAAVDTHVTMRSPSGRPVNALVLDKTRTPHAGIAAGCEWPIDARWIDGSPPRSTFTAGDPAGERTGADDVAQEEILALVATEGPLTVRDLDASGGARKRALET
ncbi:MAG: AAA family ATPase, partial [Rhodanobacteraceae bacterium]